MHSRPGPVVQVLVEPCLQRSEGKDGPNPSAGKAGTFQKFRFTRKGTGGSIVPESGKESSEIPGSKITVFRFAPESGGLKAARQLVKHYSSTRQPLIAIASPGVYNQPDFRSILLDHDVEVFVEAEESFEIQHLAPWIARLSQGGTIPKRIRTARQKSTYPDPSALEPIDMGKRLRDPDSGKLDARKTAALLGISLTDLATRICGVTKQNLSQNPTSAGIQEKLQPLEEVAQGLLWCAGDEARFRAWLKRPHHDFPLIGGKVPSPMDLILLGHANVVAAKIRNLLTGHPA